MRGFVEFEGFPGVPINLVSSRRLAHPETLFAWIEPQRLFIRSSILDLPLIPNRFPTITQPVDPEDAGSQSQFAQGFRPLVYRLWDDYQSRSGNSGGVIATRKANYRYMAEEALQMNPWLATGAFGADRDRDGVLKNGGIDPTVRMRATEVGRFNIYDPVMWLRFTE